MLKIRLQPQGGKGQFIIVLIDSRKGRDSRYKERLGQYQACSSEKIKYNSLNIERINYWINLGAQTTKKIDFFLKQNEEVLKNTTNEEKIEKVL